MHGSPLVCLHIFAHEYLSIDVLGIPVIYVQQVCVCDYLYEKTHVTIIMCVGGVLCMVWCVCPSVWDSVCVAMRVFVSPCVYLSWAQSPDE